MAKNNQNLREEIARALDPLKGLKNLVAVEIASSISNLSGSIKETLKRIHWSERLAFGDASLGKKVVDVTGELEGLHIDASLIANSSWLRAILWAFVLSLREKTIESVGRNPFKLLLLDDPQITFDPRNKRMWAMELGRIAALAATDPMGCQLVVTTHERQFLQFLESDGLQGEKALISGVNERVGRVVVISGNALQRAFDVAKSSKSDRDGHAFVAETRIYSEDLLKIMLRSDLTNVGNSNLGALGRVLRDLIKAGISPYTKEPFKRLDKLLEGGGSGGVVSILNDSHHAFDGTVGYAEAVRVKEFWDKTLEKILVDCFNVHSAFVTFSGDPRIFPWSASSVQLPPSQRDAVRTIDLFHTGVAAAAKSDGRAGDGIITI